MTTYIGKSDPTAALRVKLMEVLYVSRIWQWCSILHCQVDASRAVDLCYTEGTLPAGEEFICAYTGEYTPEHEAAHLELPATHEPLVIAPEHLMVPCFLDSCLPSSLINEVDVITPELVLRGFVICLDTGGTHGDFWGKDSLSSVHQEERCLPRDSTG
jgi:hypothetical protein